MLGDSLGAARLYLKSGNWKRAGTIRHKMPTNRGEFFEAGTIVGGVALGAVGEVFSKRAGFVGGAAIAAVGLVLLWQFVVATNVDAGGEPEPATRAALAPS